jgi:hypothetical protein
MVTLGSIEGQFLNNGNPCIEFNGITIQRIRDACEYAEINDLFAMNELSKRFINGKPVPYVIYQRASEALLRTEKRLSTRFAETEPELLAPKVDVENMWTLFWVGVAAFCMFIITWKE